MSHEQSCIISFHFEQPAASLENIRNVQEIILITSDSLHNIKFSSDDEICQTEENSRRDSMLSKFISLENIRQLRKGEDNIITLNGKAFSALTYLLALSYNFRKVFLFNINNSMNNLHKTSNFSLVTIKLVMPPKYEIGYNS